MRYKLLGRSGLRVAELALGTMTFGGDGWGADAAESQAMFEAYASAGGNLIDTGNVYTGGNSERLIGEFVASDRDHFVVATKYTLSTRRDDPNASGSHRKNLVQSLEASLRRLGTDYIDLYWVHMWDAFTPLEETLRALDDQVRAGKVLYLGISDAPGWVIARAVTLAEANGWTPFSAVQARYNLLERGVEREVLPACRDLDLAFVAWGALASGGLAGKYLRADPGTVAERDLAVAREVDAVAGEIGASCSQVALAWLRTRLPVMIPLIGASQRAQVEDNLASIDVALSDKHLERLDRVSAIELGFPYDFVRDGRVRFLGEVTDLIDDHRHPSP